MNGFGIIGHLTEHFRKNPGAANREVFFQVLNDPRKYRISTISVHGATATRVLLVPVDA